MSLKLFGAIRVTLNTLKPRQTLLLDVTACKPFKSNHFRPITSPQQSWYSSSATDNSRLSSGTNQKPKNPVKLVYTGLLSAHVKAVKLFSVSSSVVGITMQPLLYQEIVSTGNVPVILAAYSFIGFFTVVTPLLLHMFTKKYVTELSYNELTNTYIAKTLNILGVPKETHFKLEDVQIPEVPGMFETFQAKGRKLFIDPRNFTHPDHYVKLMGFDKPMDFKLLHKEETADTGPGTSRSSDK